MKQFNEMTADEIASYEGPIHWARCRIYRYDGVEYPHDIEAPSIESREAHILELQADRTIREIVIHERGVRHQTARLTAPERKT